MNYIVSSSPHIHKKENISSVMLDVIIALMPATLFGIYLFGYRAALVVLTAIFGCVLSEYLYTHFMKKKNTVGDLSAVVTGLLLGLNMPPSVPLWMVLIGSIFAIVIVKQLYGGLGKNFLNPALAARCFMIISWAGSMTVFTEPLLGADVISQATALSILKGTSTGQLPTITQAFFGFMPGSLGETSALMLLIGGAYLLIKKVIDWKIPVIFILTFVIFELLFGKNPDGMTILEFTTLEVLSGGLILGAFFMATDYVTSPTTPLGQIIFAFGCGMITFVFRTFGGYPEGVSFAILLMNILTPLIDRYTVPKKFGYVKVKGESR